MANLLDLTAQLVAAHASNTQMTTDELYKEIEKVHATLKALESGATAVVPDQPKQISWKKSLGAKSVTCLICGKSMVTLKRHIITAHNMNPSAYRKEFNIPSSQPLVAKEYSASRKKAAEDRGLAGVLAKARAKKKATTETKNTSLPVPKAKAPAPMKRTKAPVPAVKVKAPVPMKVEATKTQAPAIKKKTAVPAKVEVVKAPAKVTKKTATAKKK